MKLSIFRAEEFRYCCLLLLLFALANLLVGDGDNDVQFYTPGDWLNPDDPCACVGAEWRKQGVLNDVRVIDQFPLYGYPLHGTLFTGLNDTIQVQIAWVNYTSKGYSLTGKTPAQWFVPRVFSKEDNSLHGIPWRDSTDLGYRIRGWRRSSKESMTAPDTLPSLLDGQWSMVMDVWNLPAGSYSLCIDTTDKLPDEIFGRTGGSNYDYYKAQSLADSTNAYEACAQRMFLDGNYGAAKTWIDTLLTANATSVPGWWLNAIYFRYIGDTTGAKQAYDKAINYLNSGADPAMPDPSKRFILPAEDRYRRWVGSTLAQERSWYAP